MEFELSADGVSYTKAASIVNDVSDRMEEVVVKDFVQPRASQRARNVKVKAYNYGTVTAWHPGAGGQAWIFIDEIMID